MNLSPLPISTLLKKHRIHPSKGLGQNFLIVEEVLERIADSAGIRPGDTVLEIGPGMGNLTRHLANRVEQVVAVELDRTLFPVLHEVLEPFQNVTLVQGDILKLNPAGLPLPDGYIVAANIPYYITSAVIRHLLNAAHKPQTIALTVQKEVAERICAKPGNLSLLALSVQLFGEAEYQFTIPAEAFYPKPKIDSALLKISCSAEAKIPVADMDVFFKLAKAGFGQKRKTLKNALSSNLALPSAITESILLRAGIDPMRRAETLMIAEWHALLQAYNDHQQN